MLPEFGAPELLVIAAIALIVVGPKDLPILMRRVGQFVARMRSMAMEFRASFDEMARQSELDELRKEVEAMRAAAHQPLASVTDPMGLQQVHSDIHGALYDQIAAPAADAPHAEPTPVAAPEPEAAAEAAPKPKRKRARKAASKPGAEPSGTPEAQP